MAATGRPYEVMNMLEKNTQIELNIHAISTEGLGIGRFGDFVVFVDGAIPGDVVTARITRPKSRFAVAALEAVIQPSASRITPPCPVAAHCGGCGWQHIDYQTQLSLKKQIVTDTLTRIGGVANPPVADVAGMANPWEYRNKAVFHVDSNGKVGVYAPRSRRVVEISSCGIVHQAHRAALSAVKASKHQSLIRDVMFRAGDDSNMVALTTHDPLSKADYANLTADFADCCDTLVINGKTALGGGFVTITLSGITYKLSAASFFQVNTAQAQVLYDTALSQIPAAKTETIIDAHCGVGSIALYAASRAANVIGVDIEPAAIADATYNAEFNKIRNARFICGTAEKELPKLLATPQNAVIFLDPPRKGCDKSLLETLIADASRNGLQRIVYISCDPATLARDVKILTQGGFHLADVRPVDMFPHTSEIEVSCLLVR